MKDRIGFSQPSPEADRIGLSERLKQAREYMGLKQEDVAKSVGIPRSALSNVEAGTRKVDAIELSRLAKLYQRPLAWFTGRILKLDRSFPRRLHMSRELRRRSPSRIAKSWRALPIS